MSDKVKQNDITPTQFKLEGPHTHQGKDYDTGDTITLRKDQAVRLQEQKRGKIVTG